MKTMDLLFCSSTVSAMDYDFVSPAVEWAACRPSEPFDPVDTENDRENNYLHVVVVVCCQ